MNASRLKFAVLLALGLAVAALAAHAEQDQGIQAYVDKDYAAALKIFRPRAADGDSTAQFALGMMYANGEGVAQNFKSAMFWYRLAAKQGHPAAMHDIAVLYANGQGVPQDYSHAYAWYNLAAANASDETQRRLDTKHRDDFAALLPPAQLAAAQELAGRCQSSGFEECD